MKIIPLFLLISLHSFGQYSNTSVRNRRDSVLLRKYLATFPVFFNYSRFNGVDVERHITDMGSTLSDQKKLPRLNKDQFFRNPWIQGGGTSSRSVRPDRGGSNISVGAFYLRQDRTPFSAWVRQYDYLYH